MIFQQLFTTELRLKKERDEKDQNLQTLEDIKRYLYQLDHTAEEVPVENLERLTSLFEMLKEEELTEEEKNDLRIKSLLDLDDNLIFDLFAKIV